MSSYKMMDGFLFEPPSNVDLLSHASIEEGRKRTQRPTFKKGMRRSWTHFRMVDFLTSMRSLNPGTFRSFSADPASIFILTPDLSLIIYNHTPAGNFWEGEYKAKTAKNYEEKMAISSEGIKTEKSSMEALLSLEEEVLLETLTRSPYLFESKEVNERLEEISRDWKRRIESKKSRERSWEHILYFVHLFPRSLDLPEFAWLKEKYFNILMRRQWDSELDKSYWEALDRVRKDFTPTKPKTPEKKLLIARKFEYYQNVWARAEIFKRCKELLEIYNSSGMEEEVAKTRFLRKIKISQDIMERELGRLDRICEEEIRDEQDYLFLSLIIQNELNLIEDKDEREEGQRFWMKIWKPMSKKADKLKPTFIMEVAKETGLSKETVRKLLRKAKKESGD